MTHNQVRWRRHRGDTGPALTAILRQPPTVGQRAGDPVTIGAATVLAVFRRALDHEVVHTTTATTSSTPGEVSVPVSATIANLGGLHSVEFRVTGTDQRTYPDPSDPWWLLIDAPVATGTSSGGGGGGAATPAPLFLADAEVGTVTGDGQVVFAGAGVTINIDPAVTWFQVAPWPSQTAWALGTTPALTQAGATVDTSAAAELAQGAGGDLLVAARAGTTWYVAGADSGGGSGGTGLQELTVTAAQAVSALRVVTMTGPGVVPFEPTAANAGLVLGVTRTAASGGQAVAVVTSGTLEGASGLTPGAVYYAGPGGTLTTTQPTTGLLVAIGYAADADTFVVQVGDPIQLA